ncbi:hypothetical protein P3T27_004621 [Kitasatospora sp. MAA19]|uniref:hypothetical protein n=1 Tax=unclassified Kitasatospora TaxID=2633591 RepID=UPI002476399B|nr:hypothetical protein [Kitasatospora sp. MAA19]MDH6707884.1 hypothetical protein [Kitasatospora sp. MAA19]
MGSWRVTVQNHHRRGGGRPQGRPEGPLARRGDLQLHGRDGEVSCVDEAGRVRWRHACAGRPNAAHLSSGRVLVTTDSFEYTAWGHLGPALLLDLDDGALVAELRGERGAALGGGRFVLGLEGYGGFDTWAYDPDGALVDSWRSYGHYVVGSGLRVVETDRRRPTGSRVVRLLPGGGIEHGPLLTDPQAPAPVVLADGTVLVLDAGVLRAVGRDLDDTVLAELLPLADEDLHRFTGTLRRTADGLAVTLVERHPTRMGRYTTHRWALGLEAPR